MTDFCCEEFTENAKTFEDFEKQSDGTWSVNGSCGAYVITGMKFCPYCGAELEPKRELKFELPKGGQ